MHTDDQTATGVDPFRHERRADLSPPEVGDMLAGRFLLRSILGSGATGTVFAAVDTTVGQKVAIKLLHPGLRDSRTRERLRREVRASRSGHHNIVAVFDLHESGRNLFLSMELVEGRSLRSLIDREGPLPVDTVIDIGSQVAAALEHIHGAGLVHRDVKPGNILMASSGQIKLCDMGLARPLQEGVTVTETEMVVGTPDYMAPEQAAGSGLTASSDIYGLGLTLYQALTGEVPLKETTVIATLSRRQRGRPSSVRSRRPGCPRWLDRLILRMLEPIPTQRISAPHTLKALETQRLMPKPRRRTSFWAAASIIVVLAGIGVLHLVSQRATVMVDVGASSVTGRDREGHPTWQRNFDLPVFTNNAADLDGDGRDEVIVAIGSKNDADTPSATNDGPEIWIFDSDGDVVTHFLPEPEVQWDFDYEVQIHATPHIFDLDHDGRPEVLVVGQHVSFFPTVVFLYRPALGRWDQILSHPGYLLDVRPTPPDGNPGLRFIAVNNRLGVMEFLGEIVIEEDHGTTLNVRAHAEHRGLQSPPFQSTAYSPPFRWSAYIPLPARDGYVLSVGSAVEDLEDGGVRLTTSDGEVLVYDRYWNPTPGPNSGRDLQSLRRDFMAQLIQFTADFQMRTPMSISELRSAMSIIYADLLEEPSYRLIFDLTSAQALAQSGLAEDARDLLAETVRYTGHNDAVYRLAHLEALAGNPSAATDRLMHLMTNRGRAASGTRALYDGPHLAIRIGIENHDPRLIEKAVSLLSAEGGSEGRVRVAQALLARVHLWWDTLQPEDLKVTTRDYAPAGDAVAVLARWRNGRSHAGDAELMESFAERNPDTAFDGTLARAAALIGTGHQDRALDELNVLIQQMEFPARDNFSVHQLLDLARAMRVVALLADGQEDRARTEAARLQKVLTPGLLPAILVEEVLTG